MNIYKCCASFVGVFIGMLVLSFYINDISYYIKYSNIIIKQTKYANVDQEPCNTINVRIPVLIGGVFTRAMNHLLLFVGFN